MRRPWNIIDTPVYSLATYDKDVINMNICTYVTAVSRQPKIYSIAIEHCSKTHNNLEGTGNIVLQLLTKSQIGLVSVFGKKSGKTFNKEHYLKNNSELEEWQGTQVLGGCAAYLLLKKMHRYRVGDHHLYTFEVKKYRTKSEGNILMFQDLIRENIILS